MKVIKSNVTYQVPHWNFCNVDKFDYDGTPSKQVCQFCIKTRSGTRCVLYDQYLNVAGNQINKLPQCCRATAGFESVIQQQPPQPEGPTIPPKELMKHAISLYSKTLSDLINQGYPKQIAEQVAKKYVLGEK